MVSTAYVVTKVNNRIPCWLFYVHPITCMARPEFGVCVYRLRHSLIIFVDILKWQPVYTL